MRASAYLIATSALALPLSSAHAQTDEIQVYTGELAARREFSLTLHGNYTPRGRRVARG